MTKEELIRKLAVILAGLQVPRSINGVAMLGAACEPWDEVKSFLTGFGWTDADDFEQALKTALL